MADQKHSKVGQQKMTTSTTLPIVNERFYFVHWAPGRQDIVPRVITDSITTYAGTMMEDSYHLGRIDQNYKLTYIETWQRDRRRADLDLLIGDRPLGSFTIDIKNDDVNQQTPRFFAFDEAKETYREIDFLSTEGESEYIRLQFRKSIRTGKLTLSPAYVVQYLAEKIEYHYDQRGQLMRISTYSRHDNFQNPSVFTP